MIRLRFWNKVEVGRDDECWPWVGERNDKGYGRFPVQRDGERVRLQAHRMAYLLTWQRWREPEVVRHKCDNRACCNPRHLEPGTHADNVADRVARGRSARGERQGHAVLTEEIVRYVRASDKSTKELAEELGVNHGTIGCARNGASWAWVE